MIDGWMDGTVYPPLVMRFALHGVFIGKGDDGILGSEWGIFFWYEINDSIKVNCASLQHIFAGCEVGINGEIMVVNSF